jgi:hypothetical protein
MAVRAGSVPSSAGVGGSAVEEAADSLAGTKSSVHKNATKIIHGMLRLAGEFVCLTASVNSESRFFLMVFYSR